MLRHERYAQSLANAPLKRKLARERSSERSPSASPSPGLHESIFSSLFHSHLCLVTTLHIGVFLPSHLHSFTGSVRLHSFAEPSPSVPFFQPHHIIVARSLSLCACMTAARTANRLIIAPSDAQRVLPAFLPEQDAYLEHLSQPPLPRLARPLAAPDSEPRSSDLTWHQPHLETYIRPRP